jgi:pimeloyl-ACP methyl ester carboxylesterase
MSSSLSDTAGELLLADGRRLAFAEFGDRDGRPCMYFHFTPGSRLDPAAVFHGKAQLLDGVRLVAIDRPGFGRSDRQPGRSFVDWPNDVTAVADRLDIDKLAVLGVSGGGGYALACAARIPERLDCVAIVSGLGPVYRTEARQGMAAANRILYGLSLRAPFLARGLASIIFRVVARTLARPPRTPAKGAAATGIWNDPTARPALLATLREAVIRPGTRGLVDELALYARPWGFALEDITIDVHLWHGTRDTNVPLALAQHVADAIPRSTLTLIDGDHLAPIDHIDEAINMIRVATQ